jgi:hypothetical protein
MTSPVMFYWEYNVLAYFSINGLEQATLHKLKGHCTQGIPLLKGVGTRVRASPPENCKQLLYFKIEYCLMITVPTHKRRKSRLKHAKTIYVFTSGWVLVTFQIHSRKKFLKGLKWPLQNGPLIQESSKICAILLQDLMKKGVVPCVGWRPSKGAQTHMP